MLNWNNLSLMRRGVNDKSVELDGLRRVIRTRHFFTTCHPGVKSLLQQWCLYLTVSAIKNHNVCFGFIQATTYTSSLFSPRDLVNGLPVS